jgi:hypothetical protein
MDSSFHQTQEQFLLYNIKNCLKLKKVYRLS